MLRSILAQGAEGDENSAAELSVPTTTTNVADQQHSEPAGDEEYYAISSRCALDRCRARERESARVCEANASSDLPKERHAVER